MATTTDVITAAKYDLRVTSGQEFVPAELLEYLNRTVIVLDTALMSMDSDWLHQIEVSSGLTSGLQKVTMPTRCVSIRSIWVTDIIDSFTDLTFTASADTIATAAGTFVTNGIAANRTLGITGSTSNNTNSIGLLSVSSVTETLITVNENVIVNEGTADASGTIMQIKESEVDKISTDKLFLKRKWISGEGRPYYWAWEGTNVIFDYKSDQNYGLLFHFNQKTDTLSAGDTMPYNDEFNEIIRAGIVLLGKESRGDSTGVTLSFEQGIKSAVMAKAVRRDYVPKRYRLDY